MDKEKISIGCPDPFSVAELIEGKKIDWSKKKDEIDALAEIFGVTKEAFLKDSFTLLNPFVKINSKGELTAISFWRGRSQRQSRIRMRYGGEDERYG